MKRATLLYSLVPMLAAVGVFVLPEAEASAAGPQKGPGFHEGGYIMGTPGSIGIPVVTDDFYDLDPTFGWGLGGGWMFARGPLFKATVGGAFEHHLMIFDTDLEFDDFGGHIVRFLPEARIGVGNDKVWGYGLAGGGFAGAIVHWRNDNPFFDVDRSEFAPGFNLQLGGGVQGIVWRNLFLLAFYFEDDANDFDFDNDDDFAVHQISIEFVIGWVF